MKRFQERKVASWKGSGRIYELFKSLCREGLWEIILISWTHEMLRWWMVELSDDFAFHHRSNRVWQHQLPVKYSQFTQHKCYDGSSCTTFFCLENYLSCDAEKIRKQDFKDLLMPERWKLFKSKFAQRTHQLYDWVYLSSFCSSDTLRNWDVSSFFVACLII